MQLRARGPRSGARYAVLLVLAALAFVGLCSLGVWQLQRLAWKEALIDRVGRNAHGTPVAAPGPSAWHAVTREADEYRRVRVRGRYLGADTLVQASTSLGLGWWVLTPLRTEEGFTLLVNRGFVPDALTDRRVGCNPCEVVGLLRMSEPGGGFLRRNDPAHSRWYSRDVQAIASAQQMPSPLAPYFVDEAVAAPAAQAAWPRPGLTVLGFSNNHAVYAVTWFALAAMVACAAGYAVVDQRRLRRLSRGRPRRAIAHARD